MRRILCSLIIALVPLSAMAQPAIPNATAPIGAPNTALATPRPAAHPADAAAGTITRDAYVRRASDAAGKRFDAMDVTHKGTLSRAEIKAWRQAHRRNPTPAAQ